MAEETENGEKHTLEKQLEQAKENCQWALYADLLYERDLENNLCND